jgi:hypothetical protein
MGPQPGFDAYELVMVDGQPWVMTLDVDGYTAHHVCAVPEGSDDGNLTRSGGRAGSLFNLVP